LRLIAAGLGLAAATATGAALTDQVATSPQQDTTWGAPDGDTTWGTPPVDTPPGDETGPATPLDTTWG
jgi:hypothetical protein